MSLKKKENTQSNYQNYFLTNLWKDSFDVIIPALHTITIPPLRLNKKSLLGGDLWLKK